jgi:hypothetical protein
MSRYRKLRTEEANEFVPYFGASSIIEQNHFNNTMNSTITPYAPVPKQIPSNFNPKIVTGLTSSGLTGPIYGPTSQGHASLRYYGWGPY